MRGIPRTKSVDSTFQLLNDPYRYISHQAKLLQSDVFETRLLLEKVICMTGKEYAELFTDGSLFERRNATPEFMTNFLTGKSGIGALDGEAHFHRKQLFLSLMGPGSLEELRSIMVDWLNVYVDRWVNQTKVILYEELQEILTRTICDWAGIKLSEREVKEKTGELSSLFDSAGRINKRLETRNNRKKLERWIEQVVRNFRDGRPVTFEGSPVAVIAEFKDINGERLSPHLAAVEILNILRPLVAVSAYMVLCAHALYFYPDGRQRLKSQEAGYLDNFVNEVRRYFPFFPMIFARVKNHFEWEGILFKKGTRAILDLYGINHDERIWERPFEFNPDRFKDWKGSPYSFVPQGVGDHAIDHRCPGELLTIELMRTFTDFFTMNIHYEVPRQDLFIDLKKIPALPKSLFIISSVKREFDLKAFSQAETSI